MHGMVSAITLAFFLLALAVSWWALEMDYADGQVNANDPTMPHERFISTDIGSFTLLCSTLLVVMLVSTNIIALVVRLARPNMVPKT